MKCVILLILFTVYIDAMDSLFASVPEIQTIIASHFLNIVFIEDIHFKKNLVREKEHQYILRAPLVLLVKFSQEFLSLQELCKATIGGKQFLPQELFCLRPEERNVFTQMKNRSVFLDGNISEHDYNILLRMENKDVLKGLSLRINCLNSDLEKFGNILNVCAFIGLSACSLKGRVNSKAAIIGMLYVFCKSAIAILYSFSANYSEEEEDWYTKRIKF